MCGITGYCSSFNLDADFRLFINDAADALKHRGPDDTGIWHGEGIGLGHRRLSILDLSHGSHQPMLSVDGRYVLVFNGEIYNFRELRNEFEAAGWRFRTSGDTEIVLAALTHWGVEAALKRFVGMFAIALWDSHEKSLVLIRDRLGVKPLYYGWDGKILWFGSELKALRAYRHWQPQIDRTALAEYFQFGYVNAPRSIYRNVFKLLPGHWLELKRGGAPIISRYWSVLDALGTPLFGSEEDLADQFETLMVDAFRLRMVADVPIGMFLSGGIDSSLVTALLQKHHGNIHTFTIGFNEVNYNEAHHARQVAEYLGTNHTERILETTEAKRIIPMWGSLYDEPFADSSGIPTYLVSKMASEQVKVVLSADGGDELFSGYNSYSGMLRILERRQRFPRIVRLAGPSALRALPLNSVDRLVLTKQFPNRLRNLLRQHFTRTARRARDFYFNDDTDGMLYELCMSPYWVGSNLTSLLGYTVPRMRDLADGYPGTFPDKMCLWDLHNYLPGDILTKVDRSTMAASIEGREPLIDHRVVEMAFRLPMHLRRGALGPKHLLRKILYKYVPREFVDRPKMGFGVPLFDWLRGDLAFLVNEHLNSQAIKSQSILNPRVVDTAVSALRTGDHDAANKVWSLLAFQMWHRQWN